VLADKETIEMLFAAVIHVVRRRRRRTEVSRIPANTPPLWRLLVGEAVEAGRALGRRLSRPGWGST
jgi:hypothetical protein